MPLRFFFCFILFIAFTAGIGGWGAASQGSIEQPIAESRPPPQMRLDGAVIRAHLQEAGEVRLPPGGILIQRYDFQHEGAEVEAIVIRPPGENVVPGILLIPGYSRTAYDLLPIAIGFAREGLAAVAVSQPGFGASTGPADFAGPRTFAALQAAALRFAEEPWVDERKMAVYGYSRGALAAAQLASRTDLFIAAVFGGGIYDFAAAYEQIQSSGIRANMMEEAGLGAEATRFRSPIHDVDGFDGPILIVHGANDANAPLDQALSLTERLREAQREHELIIIPDRDHALMVSDILTPAIAFLRRHGFIPQCEPAHAGAAARH